MKKLLLLFGLVLLGSPALAMTGFFVGENETPIAVPATKIIIASHNGHHTLTIMPSVASTARDMAWLFPVPASVTAQHIREVSASLFDAIDTLSAPRLREETDPNPCTTNELAKTGAEVKSPDIKSYAVTVKHIADETHYDISFLSAGEGAKLPEWLEKNGYKLPPKADRIIVPYTQRGNSFLLVKARRNNTDTDYLKPLQITYDAPKLVLPVRLGLINAPSVMVEQPKVKEVTVLNAAPDRNYPKEQTPIDLFNDGGQAITLYVITQQGRAASPLMRSVPLGNERMDTNLPSYVSSDFPTIYNRILNMRVKAESNALITEFAGEVQLPADVLASIGVNWLNEKPATLPSGQAYEAADENNLIGGMMLPKAAMPKHLQKASAPEGKPYLTRLYFRYNATTLPQDIGIAETASRETLSLRFFTHVAAQGDAPGTCDTTAYERSLATRLAHDEQNLSRLTGWSKNALVEKFNKAK